MSSRLSLRDRLERETLDKLLDNIERLDPVLDIGFQLQQIPLATATKQLQGVWVASLGVRSSPDDPQPPQPVISIPAICAGAGPLLAPPRNGYEAISDSAAAMKWLAKMKAWADRQWERRERNDQRETPLKPHDAYIPAQDAAKAFDVTLSKISKLCKDGKVVGRKPTSEQKQGKEKLQVHCGSLACYLAEQKRREEAL